MGAFHDGMGGGMMPAPSALAPGGLSPNTRRGGSLGRRGGGGGGYRGGQRAGGSSGGSLGVLREGGGLDGGVDHDEALPDFPLVGLADSRIDSSIDAFKSLSIDNDDWSRVAMGSFRAGGMVPPAGPGGGQNPGQPSNKPMGSTKYLMHLAVPPQTP